MSFGETPDQRRRRNFARREAHRRDGERVESRTRDCLNLFLPEILTEQIPAHILRTRYPQYGAIGNIDVAMFRPGGLGSVNPLVVLEVKRSLPRLTDQIWLLCHLTYNQWGIAPSIFVPVFTPGTVRLLGSESYLWTPEVWGNRFIWPDPKPVTHEEFLGSIAAAVLTAAERWPS
jgi:hypothetical protein